MKRRSFLPLLTLLAAAALLAACSLMPGPSTAERHASDRHFSERGREVVIYALSLLDTGYRFGGKNPEAGLDCSGMVAYVFAQAAGLQVSGSAADIARQGRPVDPDDLIPGDLLFFNTANRPYSHVGIFIGNGRFVHSPSAASGHVRIDRLSNRYFSSRYHAARSYFD